MLSLRCLQGNPGGSALSVRSFKHPWRASGKGQPVYTHEVEGDTVADVLAYVEYDPKELASKFRSFAEKAVSDGRISLKERREILDLFAALRPVYRERDRLRPLVQFRKALIERLLAEGEESAEATAGRSSARAGGRDSLLTKLARRSTRPENTWTRFLRHDMPMAMSKTLFAVLGLIAVIAIFCISTYNGLVGKQQGVDAAWAQVSNQYQRRADLVPNLVKTVQGSADFEKSTLESVTNARASVGRMNIDASKAPDTAAQLEEFQKAQGAFGSALQRLLVVAERYPDLKASAGFRDLQAQLEGTENRIAVERGRFNEVAKEYNIAVRKLPAALFAGMLGFNPKPYFQAETGAEKPPEVNFDFGGKSSEGK